MEQTINKKISFPIYIKKISKTNNNFNYNDNDREEVIKELLRKEIIKDISSNHFLRSEFEEIKEEEQKIYEKNRITLNGNDWNYDINKKHDTKPNLSDFYLTLFSLGEWEYGNYISKIESEKEKVWGKRNDDKTSKISKEKITLKGDDWEYSQHVVCDTTPTIWDFYYTIRDYHLWERKQFIIEMFSEMGAPKEFINVINRDTYSSSKLKTMK